MLDRQDPAEQTTRLPLRNNYGYVLYVTPRVLLQHPVRLLLPVAVRFLLTLPLKLVLPKHVAPVSAGGYTASQSRECKELLTAKLDVD